MCTACTPIQLHQGVSTCMSCICQKLRNGPVDALNAPLKEDGTSLINHYGQTSDTILPTCSFELTATTNNRLLLICRGQKRNQVVCGQKRQPASRGCTEVLCGCIRKFLGQQSSSPTLANVWATLPRLSMLLLSWVGSWDRG